jgi:hypothetical protein
MEPLESKPRLSKPSPPDRGRLSKKTLPSPAGFFFRKGRPAIRATGLMDAVFLYQVVPMRYRPDRISQRGGTHGR